MQGIRSESLLGAGDRRIRTHPHNHPAQALKCPRCDSPNTKFCYYNNYNLSQPRHFCKSCRRYWTRGGVLRNVPVGGGCRKAKRGAGAKSKKVSTEAGTEPSVGIAVKTPLQPPKTTRDEGASRSSSDSSNLTGTTACSVSVSAPGLISASTSFTNSSKLWGYGWGLFDQGVFPEMGGFTNLLASPPRNETTTFTCTGEQQWLEKDEKLQGGFSGQTEFQARSENGRFGLLDLPGSGDQGLFDLPSSFDQSYWSQTQWTDQDQSDLFLP